MGLLLCWDDDPSVEYWRVVVADRRLHGWVVCGADMCPVYSDFQWRTYTVSEPRFSQSCGDNPGDVCYYQHPIAVNAAGESVDVELWWPPPEMAGCP